jgi:hypothetical protein
MPWLVVLLSIKKGRRMGRRRCRWFWIGPTKRWVRAARRFGIATRCVKKLPGWVEKTVELETRPSEPTS